MGKGMPWVKWDIPDWIISTHDLSYLARSAYFNLIMLAYNEGDAFLKFTNKVLVRKLGIDPEDFLEALDELVEFEKIEVRTGGIFIPSCDWRIQEFRDKKPKDAKRTEAARAARWANKNAEEGQVIENASGSMSTETKERTEQKEKKEGVKPTGTDIASAVLQWNDMAARCGLRTVKAVTLERREALLDRLENCGGLDGWSKALERIEASKFLRGSNARGWTASFDFFMDETHLIRLFEGAYDDTEKQKEAAKRSAADDESRERMAEQRRQAMERERADDAEISRQKEENRRLGFNPWDKVRAAIAPKPKRKPTGED